MKVLLSSEDMETCDIVETNRELSQFHHSGMSTVDKDAI